MTAPPKPRRKSGPSGPSTPRALRTRQGVEITLSPGARQALQDLTEARGETRSAVVERLVLAAAAAPRSRTKQNPATG